MGNSGVWLGPPPTPLCLLIFPRRSSCIVSGLVLDLSQSLYQHDYHSHLSVPPVTPRSCEVPRAESFTEDLGKASSGGARCHWTVRMIARAAHRTCPGLPSPRLSVHLPSYCRLRSSRKSGQPLAPFGSGGLVPVSRCLTAKAKVPVLISSGGV